MALKKKIKISNVKRSQHLKNKKTPTKSLQQKKLIARPNELATKSNKNNLQRIFGKASQVKKQSKSNNATINVQQNGNNIEEENEDEIYENIIDMIDEKDTDLYINHGKKRKTNVLNQNSTNVVHGNAKIFERDHISAIEINQNKKRRVDLLPIKNKIGEIIERSVELDEINNEQDDNDNDEIEEEDAAEEEEEMIDSDDDILQDNIGNGTSSSNSNAISTADLLILRQQEINRQKYRIGIICTGILEKPEDKIKNFSAIFELMDERSNDTINLVSIRRIAILSLLEVFKDVLPEYRIGQINLKTQTVRKNTMERVTYEDALLQQYKKYLQKLEKISSFLTKQQPRNSHSRRALELRKLSEVAVTCMCELLLAHSYFNFSQNIAQLLVYLLNANNVTVRATIQRCFRDIFKEDKKFDLSLFIVRRINHLIKSKSNNIHCEVLSCLLALQIKSINLDAEKEHELKQKKMEAHRAHLINMSKKEKKRKKRLAQLDKELQETRAEENKQTKHYKLTEITKMVFTIYFRILKSDPGSKLLSVTLEGLAKFSHIINLDFFADLMEVLNNLLEHNELGPREQLHCIQTVFQILSGQGEVLNIDPIRFYGHLYRHLFNINAGRNHEDFQIILHTLLEVLIKRRKNLTHHRMLAFIKRILTVSLQLMDNGTLSCLSIAKNVLQLNSSLNIILDTDISIGSGNYNAELDDPEYCNAQCTALYELATLCRHYHPIVKKMAKHIAAGVPAIGEGSLNSEIGKLNPLEMYHQYNSSCMAFNPAIPPPKSIEFKPIKGQHYYLNTTLEHYCKRTLHCPIDSDVEFLDFRINM